MAGKLRSLVGVVVTATIVAVTAAIQFIDEGVFQDFANGFFKLDDDGLLFGNKQTKPDRQGKVDDTTNNSQPIRGLETNPGFFQETEGDLNITQVTNMKPGKMSFVFSFTIINI